MKVLHERCAGLDTHKKEIVACVRLVVGGKVHREVRRFPTTTRGLMELADWLASHQVTHVAMEATGVYWKPVWHILEGHFELVLANAAHIRNVPGRKSDVNDATWIADLLAHGLIRASFVPPQPIQDLRGLTRTRRQLGREIVQHTQRIQKVLEDANIKLDSVISDLMGASGRRILEALIAGETDPAKLAQLGSIRLECPRGKLREALEGVIRGHHRFLLSQHLRLVEELERTVMEFEARIAAALAPFRKAVELITSAPGLKGTAAPVVVAEIGTDMSIFPSAGHLLSWTGMCPRLDESAGKRGSTRLRKGAPWLKPVLIQCAWAAVRVKGSYLQAQFLRLRARMGAKKAIVAVAASLLTAIYHMLRDGTHYEDLGADFFARRDPAKTAARLVRRLSGLGYEVDIKLSFAASALPEGKLAA